MPALVAPTSRPGVNWFPDNDIVHAKVFGAAVSRGDLLNFDMAETQGGDLTVFDSLHPFNFCRPHNAAVADHDLHIFGIAMADGIVGARIPILVHGIAEVACETSVDTGDFCIPESSGTNARLEDLEITTNSPGLIVARAMENCQNAGDLVFVMFNGIWGIGVTGTQYT